jgi:hypothetical protein
MVAKDEGGGMRGWKNAVNKGLLFFIDSFEDGERGHSDSERPTEAKKKNTRRNLTGGTHTWRRRDRKQGQTVT